jgi:hypothetical protein
MPKKTRSTSFENIFVSETHRAIYNEISYLKKRIHLVEGERKANYESNEEALKKNETFIKELREKTQTLKTRKKGMLSLKDRYFKLIASKLGGDKKAYEFREKSFDDTVDILECKVGTFTNKINALKYKNDKRAVHMKGVLELEASLKACLSGTKEPPEKEGPLQK